MNKKMHRFARIGNAVDGLAAVQKGKPPKPKPRADMEPAVSN
jgi:hypothetical protein